MKTSIKPSNLLFFTLGLSIIFYVFLQQQDEVTKALESLSDIRTIYFITVILFRILILYLSGLQLYLLLKSSVSTTASFKDIFRIFLITNIFNYTPAKGATTATRLHKLSKIGFYPSSSLSSIATIWINTILLNMIIAIIGFFIYFTQTQSITLIVLLITILAILYHIEHIPHHKIIHPILSPLHLEQKWGERIEKFITNLTRMMKNNVFSRLFLLILLITLLIRIIGDIITYYLLAEIGYPVSLGYIIFTSSVTTIISFISHIPGGLGISQLSGGYLLEKTGVPFELGFSLYLIFGWLIPLTVDTSAILANTLHNKLKKP